MKRFFLVFVIILTGCSHGAPAREILHFESGENSSAFLEQPQFDYFNEKFAFGLNLPEGFDLEYMDDGLVLKKWFSPHFEAIKHTEAEEAYLDYKVEIVFLPFENFEYYPNVAEYIAEKYPGYTIESAYEGYFVDEGSGNDAIRRFFRMGENRRVIYEAYMRVPSFHYTSHKDSFDELISDMKIF